MPSSTRSQTLAKRKVSTIQKLVKSTTGRPNKMQRKAASLSLPFDMYYHILTFLEPREMLRLASTSKDIMACVTHEIVIRNTVLMESASERSKSKRECNLQDLIYGLECRRIYPVSPMRMIRLVNGKTCEDKSCNNKCSTLAFSSLFLCTKCATNRKASKIAHSDASTCDRIHVHDRVCPEWMILKRPFRNSVTGERQGPIITNQDLEMLHRNGLSVDEYFETFFDSRIQVPGPEHGARLHNILAESTQESKKRHTAKTAVWRNQEKAKVDNMVQVIAQITAKLEGPAKDFCIEYTIHSEVAYMRMEYGFVEDIMGRMTTMHPRYLSERRIQQVAREIDQAVDQMAELGVLDFTCFSDDVSDLPLEAAMRRYLTQSTVPGYEFATTVQRCDLARGPKSCLLTMSRRICDSHFLKDLIATALVDEFSGTTGMEFFTESLCTVLYLRKLDEYSWDGLVDIYNATRQLFQFYAPKHQKYLSRPEVVRNLKTGTYDGVEHDDTSDETFADRIESRQLALQEVWTNEQQFHQVCQWLQDEDWQALHLHHKKLSCE